MFQGSIVALITPMNSDGSIDHKSFSQLIDWHLASQTDALVIAGTTGESATLNADEQLEIISTAVKQVNKRVPIIAGTGTNSTESTIKRTQAAEKAGADACLVVTPYYNKPTQKGLYAHYKAIAESTSLPIVLYNVPGRTACDLLPETVIKLSEIPNIVGIKEASGKIERTRQILDNTAEDFVLLSGEDALTWDLMQAGGKGVISVTANVAPKKMAQFCKAALMGDNELSNKLNTELMPLHKNLFIESNPIPTKWALQQMGMIQEGIRLPLLPLDAKYHQEIKSILQKLGTLQSIEIG